MWNQLSSSISLLLIGVVTSLHKPVDNGGVCPPDEARRGTNSVTGDPICCKPWNYTCPLNYFYEFCRVSGKWDGCRKCAQGFVQPFPSSADSPIQCYRNTLHCDQDKIALNTTAMRCMCDLAHNYYPMSLKQACDYRPCPTGQQLLMNGTCVSCPLGTYKNWTGSGTCRPWTNCAEFKMLQSKPGSHKEDRTCEVRHVTEAPTINATQPVTVKINDTATDVKVRHGGSNEFGIIGAFIVGGTILIGMLVLAFLLRKRACPRKVRNDQLYLEMNLRGRTNRHQYEQVQTSDEELENSPTIFQISSRKTKGGNRFKYPAHGSEGQGCYGNLVISSDQDNLAEELTGLTVNLPDSGIPNNRSGDDGEESLRTSGGSIPFDNFLRLTPLDSEGHQFLPVDYESQRDRDWDYTTQSADETQNGDEEHLTANSNQR